MLKLYLILQAVRQIVSENRMTKYCDKEPGGREDWDKGCKYTQGKCGSGAGCLLGQAMVKAQPELEPALAHLDREEFSFNAVCETLGVDHSSGLCPDHLQRYLSYVQEQQDSNTRTWGECVAFADGMAVAKSMRIGPA